MWALRNITQKRVFNGRLRPALECADSMRTGTVEQMDVNVEAMARDLQEILRIGAEQKRLWEVYEGR